MLNQTILVSCDLVTIREGIRESNKVGSEGGQVLTERTVEAIKTLWLGN